jgi:transposase
MAKRNLKRSFDPEFKRKAAWLVLKDGQSISQTSKNLDIGESTLHKWVCKFRSGEWDLEGKGAGPKRLTQDPRDQRIRELEAQLRRASMERDILKKAMAFCIEVPK